MIEAQSTNAIRKSRSWLCVHFVVQLLLWSIGLMILAVVLPEFGLLCDEFGVGLPLVARFFESIGRQWILCLLAFVMAQIALLAVTVWTCLLDPLNSGKYVNRVSKTSWLVCLLVMLIGFLAILFPMIEVVTVLTTNQ